MVRRPYLRALVVLYPLLTAVIVVATGNHYVLDVLAGLATFALAVALVRLASVAHVTKLLLSRKTGRLAPASEDAL
jgi:membrane-associated phospholipid phosphatase